MVKRACRLNLKSLWIIILLTVSTQCMWITSYALEDGTIIDKKINQKTKCLNVNMDIPYIKGSMGIIANEIIDNNTNIYIAEAKRAEEDAQAGGNTCSNYELSSVYSKTRETENILSLFIDYYQYFGGAHGMTYRKAYNIDKKTGQILNLSDLFNINYDYKSKIDNIIRGQIASNKDKYFDKGSKFKGIDNSTSFYLDSTNLIVYYGLYELAPYAGGIIQFKINLDDLKNGLNYNKI
jgi:hypothetical protein